MGETVFYVENSVVLYLPKDLDKVTYGIRESFNYLNGLLDLNDIYKRIRKINPEVDFPAEADLLMKELSEFENNPCFGKTGKAAKPYKDSKDLKELIKKGILLKEKADKLQVLVLLDYIEVSQQLLGNITQSKPFLKQNEAQLHLSLMIKSAFLHSHSEEKTNHFFLFIDGEEKFDTSKNPDNYFNFEVTDQNFSLSRERSRFQYIHDQVVSLIFSAQEIENKLNLDKLVVKQYSLNNQMVILTYIIGILTLVMTIVAFIPLFIKK